ncbi:hypothetical protein ABW19_dt0200900 [Dactylella cylindrospora]|nr:hypothetical protein ABW19_dt0200900 [Dactylella cylindrospora]
MSASASSERPRSLTDLPVDILTYLIYDIISDAASLSSLSKTCRLLREHGLRRINSQRVTLNLNSTNYFSFLDADSDIATDFLKGRNGRIIGRVRNVTISFGNDRQMADLNCLKRFRQFLSDCEKFLRACKEVRMLNIRSHMWYTDPSRDASLPWVAIAKELPKLNTLLLDPCGCHPGRSMPLDEYIFELEGVKPESDNSKGLSCLSLQTPSNTQIDYDLDATPFMKILAPMIVANVNTLSRLWFTGPDLHGALTQLPDGALANVRLKSLSIRFLVSHQEFIRVFGLSERPEEILADLLEDAVSNLEYLYLSDGHRNAFQECELLPYLYTPRLKSLQMGAGFFNLLPDRRMLDKYWKSFDSLERFGATHCRMANFHLRVSLSSIANIQPGLKTIALWDANDAYLHAPAVAKLVPKLKKLELLHSEVDIGLCITLGCLFRDRSVNSENLTTLMIGYRFMEQGVWQTREICTIISTIFYIQNKRTDPSSTSLPSSTFSSLNLRNQESEVSPRIDTPARLALFEAFREVSKPVEMWSHPYFRQRRQEIEAYFNALAFMLDENECHWLSGVPDWDPIDGNKNEERLMGMLHAIGCLPPPAFSRLEVKIRERTDKLWPRNTRDRRFLWEKRNEIWEFEEVSEEI